jgi:hypothetical protein
MAGFCNATISRTNTTTAKSAKSTYWTLGKNETKTNWTTPAATAATYGFQTGRKKWTNM